MYNPKYTECFQMLIIKKELENIREKLSSDLPDLPNETATRMNVVDPLLRALGWNTSDCKEVYPEFPTPNGRVDYALCSPSSEPLCFIEAKPVGKIDDADAQLFEYIDNSPVSIAVSTDSEKWRFFYPPGEGTWEDRQICTRDLINDEIPQNAEFFQNYLSYQAVQSGDAANTMRIQAYLPDVLEKVRLDDSEDFDKAIAEAIGYRPTDEQVMRSLRTHLSKSQPSSASGPNKNQKRTRKPNERLFVTMHDGTPIDDPNQKIVLFEVMKRLVDKFGGDTVLSADKKRSQGRSPRLIWHKDETDVPGKRRDEKVKPKPYGEYRISQDHRAPQKEKFLSELAKELGIHLEISRS